MRTILSLLLTCFVHTFCIGQTYFNKLYDFNNHLQVVFNFHQLNDTTFQLNFSSIDPTNLDRFVDLMTFDPLGNELNFNQFNQGPLITPLAPAGGSAVLSNGITNFIATTPYDLGQQNFIQAKLLKISNLDTVTTYLMGGSPDTASVILSMEVKEDNLLLGGIQWTINNNQSEDFWLTKCDTNGQVIWQNWYGGSGQDRLLSMDTTGNGGYVLSGFTTSPEYNASSQNFNIMVVFVDSVGNTIITRSLGGPTGESCAIRTLSDTTYLIYGLQKNSSGDNRVFIAKLNYLGSIIWEKTFAFGPQSSIHDLETVDDGFVFCGFSSDSDNDPNGLIMKTDFDGNLQWFRKYKPRNNDNYLRDLQLMPDGGFLLAGYVYDDTTTNTSDAWIMRTNCLGFDGPPEANASFQSLQAYNLMIEDLSERYGTLYVDFGDGVQDTFPEQVSPLFISHTYPQDDVYTIQIIAEACNGESDTLYHDFHAISTLGTTEFEKDINVKVYPNPSNGLFTLEYELRSPNATIEVYDLNGKLIYTSSLKGISGQHSIDLSNISKGVYLLKVNADEASSTQRIIKQ